jgi:NitT/TauT family transport system ATP-binding protein
MSLIEYKDLTKKFPDGHNPPRTVLNGINLKIEEGEFVTLVGGSGSGKTTLFNHLLGTISPTEGSVTVDGSVVEGVGPDRGIVPQRYSLYPNMTVLDNLAFGTMLSQTTNAQRLFFTPHWRKVRSEARKAALDMVARLGLDPRDADRFPHELSGGMRQRVAIGTAVIMRPRILMMDEPFGALDPETRTRMQRLILDIWKEQKLTVIFVTHMMEEAVYLGTRVIGLSKFWNNEDGTPGDGARIVLDRTIPEPHVRPESFMDTPEFHQVCTGIHRLVLDTTRRVSPDQFDLSHQTEVLAAQSH